jgi:hypothetical protein
MGGRKTAANTATSSFIGMIHEAQLYTCPIAISDIISKTSYACDNPCPSCLSSVLPSCIEYDSAAYIGKWDFTSSIYKSASQDNGSKNLDFNLIDDQTSYDPVYVHNQGIYFDGTSHIRTTNKWTQGEVYSFTYEGWIRPMTATLAGDLLEFEIAPGETDASIGFNGNTIVTNIQGVSVSIPITYTAVGDWHYVGVSVERITTTQSRVCAVFGPNAESCTTINAVLTNDAAGNTIQVGNKFNGMIKDFSLLDWPKRNYEFSSMYTTTCTAFNGVACTMCPSSTGL